MEESTSIIVTYKFYYKKKLYNISLVCYKVGICCSLAVASFAKSVVKL